MLEPTEIRARLAPVLDPDPGAPAAPDSVPAAVLVPVLAIPPEPRVVFTRRTATMSRHAGEISFPGGLIDAGEDPRSASLREAREELGLDPGDVELLGALPPVHTRVTGVLVVPFVGLLASEPRFEPNAAEIDEILEFPLATLEARGTEQELQRGGVAFRSHVFDMGRCVIWGATGRILRSFLDALGMPARTRA